MADRNNTMKVIVKCPRCNWRVLDKVTPTTGVIELKCPQCRNVVSVDLSLRKKTGAKFRIAKKFAI